MLNSRRVLLATMLVAGLMGAAALPAAAETTPSPTPTVSVTVPPKPSPTATPKPPVSPAKKAARNIRINYVSKTVARLTWDAPTDANGRTIHYYVRTAISLGGKSLAAQVTNDTTATSVTLRDVRPGSMLTPEVTTKYRKAQGRADRGSTYTQNQVVPGKPTAVSGKVKNGNATTKPSLTVTFKAPSTTGANGTLIDSYRVRLYDAAGDKVSKTETLAAGDRSVTLTGLAYGKTYYVRVAAHNSAGYGTTGKSATVTTAAKSTPNPTGSPMPTATVTPTPTLTQLVTVPLPPVPQVTPTVTPTPKPTPTQTATPLPTASATPTPNVSSAPPGVFRNASDTRWFTISIAIAVGFGVLLSVGMFIFYRVRNRRGRRG